MSNALIAMFLAVGSGAWVYNKVNRTSGGNTTSSLTVAAIAGLFIFGITIFLLGLIPE